MPLPAFFARVADSLRPVTDVDPDVLADKLEHVLIRIELVSPNRGAEEAFALACNLAARLYPRIALAAALESSSAEETITRGRWLILNINPEAQVNLAAAEPKQESSARPVDPENPGQVRAVGGDVCLRIGTPMVNPLRRTGADLTSTQVTVDAHGWVVVVDPSDSYKDSGTGERDRQLGHPLAWLAAAAVGMAEVFRCVFADELGPRGRRGPQPGGLDLLTSRPVDPSAPPPPDTTTPKTVDIGEAHLIGAGAIGQAAVYALSRLNVAGVLHVIDPQTVTMSNLQRYLLTDATSVGVAKVHLVHDALTPPAPTSTRGTGNALQVLPFQGQWGDREQHLQVAQVLVALDSARDRITVAATQPSHAYNAWTQVADLGWSRHEHFGSQPCLACLYYPNQPRPSEHQLIAGVLDQPLLRVLAYLTYNLPIGYPLPGIPIVAELPIPDDANQWMQTALVEDLVSAGVIGGAERDTWSSATIGTLYREGICAGGLLPVGHLPGDVLVPLAHQSALAGIMLIVELLSSRLPELREQRDAAVEHRYDVLRGFPQVVPRPRQRTPSCLCSDPIYIAATNASRTAQLPSTI